MNSSRILLLCSVLLFPIASTLWAQTYLGDYTGRSADSQSVTLKADSASVRFTPYGPGIVRIDLLPNSRKEIDSSFVVVQVPSKEARFSISETDSSVMLTTFSVSIICRKYPLRITFLDSTGTRLLSEPNSGGLFSDNRQRGVRFALDVDEHFYGTGERGTSLDKRGQAFECYNRQIGGYSTPLPTMNLNVPFLATTHGYALLCDNTYRGYFDLGATDSTAFSYRADGGELTYYLFVAATIPQQLEKYTWLTGRQPLPPRWAFGYIQSKNRYESESEARATVKKLREERIPCDAIVLDLAWFKNMGDVAWNDSLWPNHEKMIADFLSQGMKTILITEPYIVERSQSFREAAEKGYLAEDSAGKPYLLDRWWSCGGCNAALLDITKPQARAWWWAKHPAAFGDGVAGIWTDLGEPERHPADMMHFLGAAPKIHNIYDLLWAKTIYEGFSSLRPGMRVVNLTRSGWVGIQRYGVLPWSGDVARSFGGLAVQLPMVLNMGMSGLAYHNSDIGGYSRIRTSPELYVRWMEYGTFCPIARAHGAGEVVNGYPTEPWKFGAEAERICRSYIEWRYRLLPYIYTMAYENYATGIPLVRPLFWLDPADTNLTNESTAYMWGEAFLVSPVVDSGRMRQQFYLPRGRWVDFWTDSAVAGGRAVDVAAPLARLPIFVKEGSLVPMAPVMQWSNERPLDTLFLQIYPLQSGTSSYTMYEDDGATLQYQSGHFARTTFTQTVSRAHSSTTLEVRASAAAGNYAGKPGGRTLVFEIHRIRRKPTEVRVNGLRLVDAGTNTPRGKRQGYHFDGILKRLRVWLYSRSEESASVTLRIPAKAH